MEVEEQAWKRKVEKQTLGDGESSIKDPRIIQDKRMQGEEDVSYMKTMGGHQAIGSWDSSFLPPQAACLHVGCR